MKRLILLLLSVWTLPIFSQITISTAGQTVTDANVQLSWTIGEPITVTGQNGNSYLMQGYQQVEFQRFCNGEEQVGVTCIDVPVELTTFNAYKRASGVLLEWQTASEINNAGFEVQRSKDGKTWENLGFVEGVGNTLEIKDYTYWDEAPLEGVNYYRLKQLDFDGNFEYSLIVSVLWTKAADIVLSPNPTNGKFRLDGAVGGSVKIANQMGVILKTAIINNSDLDMSDLPSGLYVVQFQSNQFFWVGTILKR